MNKYEFNDEVATCIKESESALYNFDRKNAKERLESLKGEHPEEFEQALKLYNQGTQETVQLDNSGDCYLDKPQSSQMAGGNVNSNYAPVVYGANNVPYLQQVQLPYWGYQPYIQQGQFPYAGYSQYGQNTFIEVQNPAVVPSSVENTKQNDNTQSYTAFYEDPINIALIKVDISQKELNELENKQQVVKSKDGCLILSNKVDFKNRSKNRYKHHKLTDFIISEVEKDEKGFICKLVYKINSELYPQWKKFFISKEDAVSGKFCKRIREEGIPCGDKKIDNILLTICERKAIKIETPDKAGLDILGDRYFMTTRETIASHSYPPVTEKSFDMNSSFDGSPKETVKRFCECILSFSDIKYILTLILIRMMAIMTNVFANNGIRFRRLISTENDCYMLCHIVQVYDREHPMDALSIDQKKLKAELSERHCEAVVFSDSIKDKKNATKYAEALYHAVCDCIEKETADKTKKLCLPYDCIAVLASENLGSLLSEERVLYLKSNYKITQEEMSGFDFANQAMDRYFIGFLTRIDKLDEMVFDIYERFKAYEAVRGTSFAGEYAVLMTVYFLLGMLINKYFELPVSLAEMQDYLLESFVISQKHRQLTGISDEFISCFNYLVEHEDIVLMKINDNKELADTENSKVICCKDDYLYIKNGEFDFIVSRMKQPDNTNQVRKALKAYLKCDKSGEKETYKYSVRIGDKHEKVTAVSTKVLSAATSLMIRESVDSVINTDDGIERIFIGSNKQGQKYYWSYGHPDAAKSHIVLIGKTRMGKTCAMNHIAGQLYNNGHSIVYLSFKNGDPKSNLLNHGFNEQFLEEKFNFIQIKNLDTEKFSLPDDKITVLYCSKYSDMVERTARMLYEYVSDGSGKELFVVIDEAHMLNHSKGSAMYCMYNMGAGNGLHLITSYQSLNQIKPSEREIIQGDIVICFKAISVDDGTVMAKRYQQKPYTQFGGKLVKLQKRECYLIGELENSNGDMDEPPAVKITIPDVNL